MPLYIFPVWLIATVRSPLSLRSRGSGTGIKYPIAAAHGHAVIAGITVCTPPDSFHLS